MPPALSFLQLDTYSPLQHHPSPLTQAALKDGLIAELQSWKANFKYEEANVYLWSLYLEATVVASGRDVVGAKKKDLESRGLMVSALKNKRALPLTAQAEESWRIGEGVEAGTATVGLVISLSPFQYRYLQVGASASSPLFYFTFQMSAFVPYPKADIQSLGLLAFHRQEDVELITETLGSQELLDELKDLGPSLGYLITAHMRDKQDTLESSRVAFCAAFEGGRTLLGGEAVFAEPHSVRLPS